MRPSRRGWCCGSVHRVHPNSSPWSVPEGTPVMRMLPVELVDAETTTAGPRVDDDAAHISPLYEFEPALQEVLDVVLPMYIASRIHNALLQSAASETASPPARNAYSHGQRRRTDRRTTPELNASARQAEITQEISEICRQRRRAEPTRTRRNEEIANQTAATPQAAAAEPSITDA